MKTATLPRPAGARRKALEALGRIALGAAAFAGPAASTGRLGLAGRSMAAEAALPRPHAWQALLREAAAGGHPVVVLFSTPGCAYCRLVRHDHLRHLAAATPQESGVRVVELSLGDRRPFDLESAAADNSDTPAPGTPSRSADRSSRGAGS
ncbi:MAG TPA: hypothetical protein PK177_20260, partial [Burkholderiaceae bacterium]|nr:hypothetical protein [Burkholderiaceae bacterium]